MTIHEELLKFINQLPDASADVSERLAVIALVSRLPSEELHTAERFLEFLLSSRSAEPSAPTLVAPDEEDPSAWAHLSAAAFARDWDLEADDVYGRLP